MFSGIENVIRVLPVIKSAIPFIPKSPDKTYINKRLVFTADDSVGVGQLTEISLVWEKAAIGINHDVAFTPAGNMAVTDVGIKCVVLFDQLGRQIASSVDFGVGFKSPRGICYHKTESALVVADYKDDCVVLLDANNLRQKRRLILINIKHPFGVDVIGNDIIVTHLLDGLRMISIHDVNTGIQLKTWEVPSDFKRTYPDFVAVRNHNDNNIILISDKDAIDVYDKKGVLLDTLDTDSTTNGMVDLNGNILVAISSKHNPGHILSHDHFFNLREIISWKGSDWEDYGGILSLAVYDNCLVVLGGRGIRLYDILQT